MTDPIELMERYQAGDQRAFRALYGLAAPRLRNYLIRLTNNVTLGDDLLQQTFLKIHRARAAYVRGADPMPWFYAIAHRTFLDEARRATRAIVRSTGDDLPEVAAAITGGSADHYAEPADPALTAAALDALAVLPPPQREAVVLMKLEGKSVAEAAEIAGTTVGAMKLRAHRGYEALRRLLGRTKGVV